MRYKAESILERLRIARMASSGMGAVVGEHNFIPFATNQSEARSLQWTSYADCDHRSGRKGHALTHKFGIPLRDFSKQ